MIHAVRIGSCVLRQETARIRTGDLNDADGDCAGASEFMSQNVIAASIATACIGTVAVMAMIGSRRPRCLPEHKEAER